MDLTFLSVEAINIIPAITPNKEQLSKKINMRKRVVANPVLVIVLASKKALVV